MKLGFERKGKFPEQEDRRSSHIAVTEIEVNDTTRTGVYLFAALIFAASFLASLVISLSLGAETWVAVVIAAAVGALCTNTFRVAPQWEKVAIMRLGKFDRAAGPGFYLVIPFVEYASVHIDQRVITSSFSAEAALTADLVPVDVDAILFWLVWDPKKACLEVQKYPKAVVMSAQTALRDAIGQVDLADISTNRRRMNHDLEKLIEDKCNNWGIEVLSVEIRNITIPEELQNALSREAQAQKERDARIVLAEVEKDISDMYAEAAEIYKDNPEALKLRAMTLAYEGAREGKGVLLAPTSLADGFDLSRMFDK